MESNPSEVYPMNGYAITGVVVGAVVVLVLLVNAKDIARYVRISTM